MKVDIGGHSWITYMLQYESFVRTVLFGRMFSFFEPSGQNRAVQEQERASLLQQIILTASRAYQTTYDVFSESISYIHQYYHTPLRIPALAKMEHVSHSHYIERFKQAYGVSPMAYVVWLRLQTARDLLKTTTMSIQTVAHTVGYDDPHFFSKLFKKYMSCSPKQYRKA